MFRQIGPTEILVILGIVVLLFGGRKLPELARGSGRALRIFKSEVKAGQDEDENRLESSAREEQPPVAEQRPQTVDPAEVTRDRTDPN
ncbi:Sec-independent protein translocase subunit TatA [Aeromicrobium sp. YIM 150415]|uniref:Sec-independent protein translocase protein TatA n=1 Tax=Aeromicrobium piscarium TaxID=2590901 RepID=A0A554SFP8_9ACTN|nr:MULTISPECIES: Sec-independent protein translocase subunit TatA [Aeromicrobium]MBM9462511.1 Sec-independent protein translocase subunit TatA [Aeromicrobium sp. YIM 150415]TSD65168.1 Sec-independent protein translocase subunit TatA [Aeromicrobium piscarium]